MHWVLGKQNCIYKFYKSPESSFQVSENPQPAISIVGSEQEVHVVLVKESAGSSAWIPGG